MTCCWQRRDDLVRHNTQRILRVALTLFAAAGAMSGTQAASADQPWGRNYFPNVPLITQTGKTVHFYDDLLKGKSVAINVIYTRCKDRCPLETAKLAQVQRLLGNRMGTDIFFYSISIDPEWDTPAVLREYAEKFSAGPGWLFLTGKREDIAAVQKKIGLYSRTDAVNPDGHLPSLMIGNEPTGQWMLNSAVDNPRFLAITLTNFLIEWKNNQVVTGRSYESARPIAPICSRPNAPPATRWERATASDPISRASRERAISRGSKGSSRRRTRCWRRTIRSRRRCSPSTSRW